MTIVCWLLALQGLLGAFDTLWFHEWRARLPAGGARSRPELRLHAARSIVYAVLFATLPNVQWRGAWTFVLAALLLTEIVLTLKDFAIEDDVRRPLGGVEKGERATHAVLGIVYGAMLAYLVPQMIAWWRLPTSLAPHAVAPEALRFVLALMALGVLASGLRDAAASLGMRWARWPWAPWRGGARP